MENYPPAPPAEEPAPNADGDTEMTEANPAAAMNGQAIVSGDRPQPPLGRHASLGDQQPVLRERQISDAVPAAPQPPMQAAPVPTNGNTVPTAVPPPPMATMPAEAPQPPPEAPMPQPPVAPAPPAVPTFASPPPAPVAPPPAPMEVDDLKPPPEESKPPAVATAAPVPMPSPPSETPAPMPAPSVAAPPPAVAEAPVTDPAPATENPSTPSVASLPPPAPASSPTNQESTNGMANDSNDTSASAAPSEANSPDSGAAMIPQRPPGPPGLGPSIYAAPSAGAAAAAAAAASKSSPPAPPTATVMPPAPAAEPPAAEPAAVAAMAAQAPAPEEAPAPEPPRASPPPAAASAPSPSLPPPAAAASKAKPARMRELRVEDALIYLDDVKREFGDRPRVYNEFLTIMKNFKCQEVDTPGVIARVSKLFRGYNNLILGFNKFLPDGYKISMRDLEEADARYAREQEEQELMEREAERQRAQGNLPEDSKMPAQYPYAQNSVAAGQGQQNVPSAAQAAAPKADRFKKQNDDEKERRKKNLKQPPAPPAASNSAVAQRPPGPPGLGPAAAAPAPAAPQQQAVEFDHAISYVTTIKRRFADDPGTYHAFLEILHTYQKEQRGIKEVLEQVAHLFQDHPDLLKEFTFFLPDAVQEQAKERLHRAAADSEARMAAQRAQQSQGQPKVVDMTSTAADAANRGRKRKAEESVPTILVPQKPESYVYNSAVERQFFDTVREALAAYTRDGGQAWAEFLKCLDMYAQEILSKSEMFKFVEPLLGKRHNKLFEEFKRIIQYAGAQSATQQQSQQPLPPNLEDSWYSVPLSEIDFSRCRRCSPSYRALPRDYPSPPCGDRSAEEAKVLNDVWVSLPVGSEESYTFRHMRRNMYEENLFRCEDERFEIDMAIDSNAATLARLEPIAEEIAQLAENELILPETSTQPKPASMDQGMGGKRFHYTFDKTILGVHHRNSITRIYGDAGEEMLDLIVKNPTVAVPLIVERLRQKDTEWRKVRTRLNKRWKDVAEQNYYRSLDHRSLTWRTTDKRAISTRTLVSEIKDRAANNGRESEPAFQARLDKAKEEHGGFYEVTMGSSLKRDLDLTYLPKPTRKLFTPHMSFMYENTSWAHQDAYRILAFALERGSISPADKERCHRLWFDFLGPWFNLSLDWMLKPAVIYQDTTKPVSTTELPRIVSNGGGDDSMADDDDDDSDGDIAARVVTEDVRQLKPSQDTGSYMDHHPLPAGAAVSTLYGDGRIIESRRADNTYLVQLPFGRAFLRPSAVLCSIIPAEKSGFTSKLRAADRSKLDRPDDMLAIGTQSLYLFFRLHQILVRRLGIAKELAYSVKDDPTIINMVEHMPGEDRSALGRRRYDSFLSLVFALLDGGMVGTASDGHKFDDRVRALLGHGGYELTTMDKLISHILKNLQSMANDDAMWNLIQVYRRHMALGSFKPEAFKNEAASVTDGEQMYAFQICPLPKEKGDKAVLHMEYLGVITESGDEGADDVASVADSQSSKRQRR